PLLRPARRDRRARGRPRARRGRPVDGRQHLDDRPQGPRPRGAALADRQHHHHGHRPHRLLRHGGHRRRRRTRRPRRPLRLPALRVRPDVGHRGPARRRHLPDPVRRRLRGPLPAPPGSPLRTRTQAAPAEGRRTRRRRHQQGRLTRATPPPPRTTALRAAPLAPRGRTTKERHFSCVTPPRSPPLSSPPEPSPSASPPAAPTRTTPPPTATAPWSSPRAPYRTPRS